MSMEYRLCICTKENSAKRRQSVYAFYNQHEFCVYRRVVDALCADSEEEYVRLVPVALEYFRVNIRNRYYTEHFSELLDEDRGVVLCPYKELVSAFDGYRKNKALIPEKYEALRECFDTPTVRFEYCEHSSVSDACEAIII